MALLLNSEGEVVYMRSNGRVEPFNETVYCRCNGSIYTIDRLSKYEAYRVSKNGLIGMHRNISHGCIFFYNTHTTICWNSGKIINIDYVAHDNMYSKIYSNNVYLTKDTMYAVDDRTREFLEITPNGIVKKPLPDYRYILEINDVQINYLSHDGKIYSYRFDKLIKSVYIVEETDEHIKIMSGTSKLLIYYIKNDVIYKLMEFMDGAIGNIVYIIEGKQYISSGSNIKLIPEGYEPYIETINRTKSARNI